MDDDVLGRGLVLLGCGRMGSAMLGGWLAGGMAPGRVWVVDPAPSDWLRSLDGLHLNDALPERPGIVLVAVKPQMMRDALPDLARYGGGDTLFLSVAAGVSLAAYAEMLGPAAPVIRAMPNTPASVGRGITAMIGNTAVDADAMDLAERLLSAVGEVVRLAGEDQMDAVTAVSGCGPAYVFHLIEAMAAAGEAEGLAPDLALRLARATVAGAGHLAEAGGVPPDELRRNVTSPGGVTAVALEVLMDDGDGLPPLMRRTVAAAVARSRELAG